MTFSTAALLHRGLDHLLHVLHPATILHGRGKEDDAREVLLLLYGHGQVVGQKLNTEYMQRIVIMIISYLPDCAYFNLL